MLVGLVFAVFGQTLAFSFVNFDDDTYVTANPVVDRGLTFDGFKWALTNGSIGHWHPLTWLSHMLDVQLFGMWAGGHHLTNVILHAAATVVLFLALWRMTGSMWRCAFVAAAWAIHPLRAESVAWISERKDVLSVLFFAITLDAYVRYVRRPTAWRYRWVAISFALGLLSKDMLVTLPCLLLILDYWPLRRMNGRASLLRLVEEKVPLFVLSALSVAMTLLAPEKLAAADQIPFWLRIENAIVSCGVYLRQSVWPVGLAAEYPGPTHGFPLWEVAGVLGLLCLITAAAFALRKQQPVLLAGWLWFVGTLVPVIGLVQISYYAHADRYTYLPQIGLLIAATWLIADWTGPHPERRMVLGSLAAVFLSVMAVEAYWQVSYWHDSEALWTHALECTANNARAHCNLGVALANEGRLNEAIAEFDEAIRITPAYANAHCNLGDALYQLGRTDTAIAEFREALRIGPATPSILTDLGIALADSGDPIQAVAAYGAALQIDPNFSQARYDLGVTLFNQGQTAEAVDEFQEALRIDPGHPEFYDNLGRALAREGRLREAVSAYQEALRLDPGFAECHGNLADALYQEGGRKAEAIAEYRRALELNPADADAHYKIGNALQMLQRSGQGIDQFQKTIVLEPAGPAGQNALSWTVGVRQPSPGDTAGGPRLTALSGN